MRKTQYFQMEFKHVEVKEDGSSIFIEGFASTPDIDSYDDIVKPSAFRNTMGTYMQKPLILLQHNMEKIIGKAVDYRIEDNGLWIRVELINDMDNTFKNIQEGLLGAFSIGFRALKWDLRAEGEEGNERYIREITELRLVEVSVVSFPANENARFSLTKSVKSFFDGISELKSLVMGAYEVKNADMEITNFEEEMESDEIKEVEEKEEEKKSLYVFRKVKNADDLKKFASEQGIKEILNTDDMHVTVAFSKKEVNWNSFEKDSSEINISLKNAKIEKLGDALVVKFESKELEESWKKYIDGGASWDFKDYNPHISLSYNAEQDIEKSETFTGEFKLGEEIFDEVKTEFLEGFEKKETTDIPTEVAPEGEETEIATTENETKQDDIEKDGEIPSEDIAEEVKSDEVKALESEIDSLKGIIEAKDVEIKELTESTTELKQKLSEKEDEIKSYLTVAPENNIEKKSSTVNNSSVLRYPEFR